MFALMDVWGCEGSRVLVPELVLLICLTTSSEHRQGPVFRIHIISNTCSSGMERECKHSTYVAVTVN